LLDLFRWTVEGEVPTEKKFVLVGAPHTSNWDFVLGMAALCTKRLRVSWMGKESLFRAPEGALFRALGGIPIERSRHHHYVDAMVREFSRRDRFVLLLSAEGTRSLAPSWKSGFYHIALGARVPICLGYLDYSRKRMGFGPLLWPTGDAKEDMDFVRNFYADKTSKHPEKATPPLLMEEARPFVAPGVEDDARSSQA
jgi:1-acyl-sn-glycerol-3-phosphate acyltransferase